jgi:uncharacterized protein (DUF1330 family)
MLVVLTGVGIGAAALEGLHAQAKPTTYVVVAIRSIKDPEVFKSGVVDKASAAALSALGGRCVIRTQDIKSLDGPSPQGFVLLAFDSVEKARAWYDSPSTEEINGTRMKSTDSLSFIVEGVSD